MKKNLHLLTTKTNLTKFYHMLIIGSHALRTYNRDRTVKDIDIIATRE